MMFPFTFAGRDTAVSVFPILHPVAADTMMTASSDTLITLKMIAKTFLAKTNTLSFCFWKNPLFKTGAHLQTRAGKQQ